MGSIFAPPPSPKAPKVAPLPKPPRQTDEPVEDARNLARRRALASRGRAGTIRTSGLGAPGEARVVRNSMLGGGGSQ